MPTRVRGGQLASPLEIGGGLHDYGRATANGEWITVPYAAGNFTADVGTWDVDSGDLIGMGYRLNGLSMLLAWNVALSNVSNAGALLRLLIPGGFTIGGVGTITRLIRCADAGAANVVGLARATAGATYIEMRSNILGAAWAATSGNNTGCGGDIEFPLAP